MQKIVMIFQSLGVDESFFIQFVIILLLYFFLKNLVFLKLQEVLDDREQQTSILDRKAKKILSKTTALNANYDSKLTLARQEVRTSYLNKVREIEGEISLSSKQYEERSQGEYERKKIVLFSNGKDCKKRSLEHGDLLVEKILKKLTS